MSGTQDGHVAIVTGANHGIGAAVARALAREGCAVLCAYWPVHDPADAGLPDEYRRSRDRDAGAVVSAIHQAGGRALAVAQDLRAPEAAGLLFDAAEEAFGPVDILINNATGWVADSFAPAPADRHGRALQPVTAASWSQQFAVDAMAPALLIGEFARRHAARGARWGRIVGLTSGGSGGFPQEVSYGAAKAAQENYTMSAAAELAPLGITANMVHPPVTDTGWITDSVRRYVADSGTRVASPEQVAEVICQLVSDSAALISGNRIQLR
ncbi:SDR family NAD(P)-dependent oxidoreductase [Micromonospora carbonacea]|uniref:SDR family NAD(P)-dependent oxidoreductase n=1 Tax=Micromonospora carbonacea TaxID=47853 RepID=UPI0033E896B5